MGNRTNYSPRKYGTVLDWIHIVTGVTVVILAVLAFTNPSENMILFPIIFFMASVLNLTTGWFYLKMYPRMKKKRASGAGYLILGALLFVLCIISAVSLWGNA
ncbi:MAG: hypothetical protein Q4C63_09935 [Eubacteriales bacterium]|nr:hypothetical protein [Eubacteriales bacterium]